MRVTCISIADFLDNLKSEPDGAVYRDTIYINTIKQPLDKDKRTSVRFMVVFRVSTIVDVVDGQYLLELEEECGVDYLDASQEKTGSEEADRKKEEIKSFCDGHGLSIRPGIVDF